MNGELLNPVREWLGLSASMIRCGEDFSPRAEAALANARASIAKADDTMIVLLDEVERLRKALEKIATATVNDGAPLPGITDREFARSVLHLEGYRAWFEQRVALEGDDEIGAGSALSESKIP